MMKLPIHHCDHPLARMDGRVKLVAALAILLLVLSCRGTGFPLAVAAFSIFLTLAAGIRLRLVLLRFAQPLILALMVVLLKLFAGGNTPLFSVEWWGFTFTGYGDGLREGGRIACRIIGAVSLVNLVAFTTSFTELMAALAWLRVPRGLVEVSFFAWRYLFVLLDDAMVIYHAQRNRLGYAGYRRGLSSFGTLTGSLVVKAFDTSQTITTSMVQRGYDGTLPLVAHKPFARGDVVAASLVVVVMAWAWNW